MGRDRQPLSGKDLDARPAGHSDRLSPHDYEAETDLQTDQQTHRRSQSAYIPTRFYRQGGGIMSCKLLPASLHPIS